MSRYPSICFFLIWNYLFPNVSVSSSICQINSSDKHMIGQIFKQMVWQIFLSILLMICWTECPILYWMCQTKRLNIFLTVYHNICFIMCLIYASLNHWLWTWLYNGIYIWLGVLISVWLNYENIDDNIFVCMSAYGSDYVCVCISNYRCQCLFNYVSDYIVWCGGSGIF